MSGFIPWLLWIAIWHGHTATHLTQQSTLSKERRWAKATQPLEWPHSHSIDSAMHTSKRTVYIWAKATHPLELPSRERERSKGHTISGMATQPLTVFSIAKATQFLEWPHSHMHLHVCTGFLSIMTVTAHIHSLKGGLQEQDMGLHKPHVHHAYRMTLS